MTDRVYTSGDVARALGLSRERIRHLVALGNLRVAGITVKGLRLFAAPEVERLRVERARRRAGPVSER